jgi:hypothetical protein
MAIGELVRAKTSPDVNSEMSYPVGLQSDWVVICTAPNAAESGDAVVSGKVVRPGSIVREDQHRFQPSGRGTTLLVALKYDVGVSAPTVPVVRVFGRDQNDIWHILRDAAALEELPVTLDVTLDAINDAGSFKITTPVEVDLDGSIEVIVAVQTAFSATGTVTNSELLAKVK